MYIVEKTRQRTEQKLGKELISLFVCLFLFVSLHAYLFVCSFFCCFLPTPPSLLRKSSLPERRGQSDAEIPFKFRGKQRRSFHNKGERE